MFSCPVAKCRYKSDDWRKVEEHCWTDHGQQRGIYCQLCNQVVLDINHHHDDIHNADKSCPICRLKFNCFRAVYQHITNAHHDLIGITKLQQPVEAEEEESEWEIELSLELMQEHYKGPLGKMIYKDGYLIMFDEIKNRIIFAFKVLTNGQTKRFKKLTRPDHFEREPEVPNYYATEYAINCLGYENGHLVPAKDCSYSRDAFKGTCNMINVSPMTKELNRGKWKSLESHNRQLARCCDEVHYFSIPIYDDTKSPVLAAGGYNLDIPVAFAKLTYLVNGGKTIRSQAFIFDNNTDRYRQTFWHCNVQLEELVHQTKLHFIPIGRPLQFDPPVCPSFKCESDEPTDDVMDDSDIIEVNTIACPVDKCNYTNENWREVEDHAWKDHTRTAGSCHICKDKVYLDIRKHHHYQHNYEKKCSFCEEAISNLSTHISRYHCEITGLTQPKEIIKKPDPEPLLQKMQKYFKRDVGKIIIKDGYLIAFDEEKNRPIFAFKSMTKHQVCQFGTRNRPRIYSREASLPDYPMTDEAIKYSGHDNGHLVAALDCSDTDEAFKSTFSIANISPMTHNLNNGRWQKVERHNRKLAVLCNEVNYFSIPIYSEKNAVPVSGGVNLDIPRAFAKITFLEKPDEPTTSQAFIFENNREAIQQNFWKFRVSHEDFTNQTNLEFAKVIRTWDYNPTAFRCKQIGCSVTCLTKEQSDEHFKSHDDHVCSLCWRKFATADEVVGHLRTHKKHKCTQCFKVFYSNSELKHHLQTHTGVKPFKCTHKGCKKAFFGKKELRKHFKRHSSVKPFKCNAKGCKKAYSHKRELTNHKKTHLIEKTGKMYKSISTDKLFKCDEQGCSYVTAYRGSLTTHKRTHSGDRPYKCEQCGYRFTTASGRMRHIKKIH